MREALSAPAEAVTFKRPGGTAEKRRHNQADGGENASYDGRARRRNRHPPSAEMAVTGRFNRRKADFGSCSDLP